MADTDLKNDLLSIKEFSEIVGMTTETLRYYDKKGLFQPTMLGEGALNKYRYYAPTQITTVKMIRVLTEIGVPLDTVKDLTKTRSPENMIKLFSKQKNIVADEFMRFLKAQHDPELNLSYPIGGYWGSMDAFISESSQLAQFFFLDPKGFDKKSKGLYLTGYTRGHYGQTNDLPSRMAMFAKQNGLIFIGLVYNIYLFDEMSINEPEQYLLQASTLVKETHRVATRRPIRRL